MDLPVPHHPPETYTSIETSYPFTSSNCFNSQTTFSAMSNFRKGIHEDNKMKTALRLDSFPYIIPLLVKNPKASGKIGKVYRNKDLISNKSIIKGMLPDNFNVVYVQSINFRA